MRHNRNKNKQQYKVNSMLKFDYFGNGLINSNEACELSELSEAAAAAAATTAASDVIALRFA